MKNYTNIFVFGIDGAGSAVFHTECPNIKRLLEWGGSLCHAKTVFPSISAQCWGSLLLGVTPGMHGYNNDLVTDTRAYLNSPYPTLCAMVKEAYPDWEIASFSSWESINIGIIEDLPGIRKVSLPDETIAAACAKYVREGADGIVFLQLDDVDHEGHVSGFGSKAYYEQMKRADNGIGQILDAIEESGKKESSLIMVTADHGGGGENVYEHGSRDPKDMDIFIAAYDGRAENGTAFGGGSIMDITPFLLEKMGIQVPAYMTKARETEI